jgi:phosphopantetheinyl transferase (holo-ACP synthase)
MTGTGNDVVSLNAINVTRTNQFNFYSKILSQTEKSLYNDFGLAGIPFENFVWILWSIKESAYKLLQRHEPELVFTPIKFTIVKLTLPLGFVVKSAVKENEEKGFQQFAGITGVVTSGPHYLYSYSLMYDSLIHTVVNTTDDFENTCWGFKLIENTGHENQSKEVRSFLIERLQQLYGATGFEISKNNHGCPVLLKEGIEVQIPVSLSHHENIIAYSFQKTNL